MKPQGTEAAAEPPLDFRVMHLVEMENGND